MWVKQRSILITQQSLSSQFVGIDPKQAVFARGEDSQNAGPVVGIAGRPPLPTKPESTEGTWQRRSDDEWGTRDRAGEDLMPMQRAMWGVATHAKGMLTARSSGAGSDFRRQIAGGDRPEPYLARLGQTSSIHAAAGRRKRIHPTGLG